MAIIRTRPVLLSYGTAGRDPRDKLSSVRGIGNSHFHGKAYGTFRGG